MWCSWKYYVQPRSYSSSSVKPPVYPTAMVASVCHQLVCTSGQNLLVMHGVVFDPLKMGGLCMKITVITEVLMESF